MEVHALAFRSFYTHPVPALPMVQQGPGVGTQGFVKLTCGVQAMGMGIFNTEVLITDGVVEPRSVPNTGPRLATGL